MKTNNSNMSPVCVWQNVISKTGFGYFKTACGKDTETVEDATFCKYCGGKIKMVAADGRIK